MNISRRSFLAGSGGGVLAMSQARRGLARGRGLKLGVTDWNLHLTGKVEAVETAAQLGFDGVQVSLGRQQVGGKLPLDDAVIQQQYLTAAKMHKIPLDGTCLDILHVNYLKNDKLGQKWVADSIPITKKLNAEGVPVIGKAGHWARSYVAKLLNNRAVVGEYQPHTGRGAKRRPMSARVRRAARNG